MAGDGTFSMPPDLGGLLADSGIDAGAGNLAFADAADVTADFLSGDPAPGQAANAAAATADAEIAAQKDKTDIPPGVEENIFTIDGQLLSLYVVLVGTLISIAVLLGGRQRLKDIEKVKKECEKEPDIEKKKQMREDLKTKWSWMPWATKVSTLLSLVVSLYFVMLSAENLEDTSNLNTQQITTQWLFVVNFLVAIAAVIRTVVVFADSKDEPAEIDSFIPIGEGL